MKEMERELIKKEAVPERKIPLKVRGRPFFFFSFSFPLFHYGNATGKE